LDAGALQKLAVLLLTHTLAALLNQGSHEGAEVTGVTAARNGAGVIALILHPVPLRFSVDPG